MSTPYAGYPYPAPPPVPGRRRPRAWWFAVGALLMVAAVVVASVTFVRLGERIAHTDARFRDVGQHRVALPSHVERGLYAPEEEPPPSCVVTDDGGRRIELHTPGYTFTFDGWTAFATFDTGDGEVTVTCRGRFIVSDLRIAAVPGGRDLVRAGLVGVGVPLVLGGAGALVVLVTAILWFTRRPAPGPWPGRPAAPGP